jgi:hypothetical protein
MSDCQWDESLKCIHCGYQARKSNTRRMCGVNPSPTTIEKVSRYAAAIAKWIAAGRPTRSQEQIDAILATHCGPCEHFKNEACNQCGCKVNKHHAAWRNKLAMATEACPLDPPKWGAEP